MKTLSPILLCVLAGACSTGVAKPATPMPAVSVEEREIRGVRYIDVAQGAGRQAERGKCLFLHYDGWLTNGRRFDSSHDAPGEPIAFVMGSHVVIEGWEAGVEGMRTGGHRRLFIPSRLGYGEKGRPPVIPANASLTFDVELVGVTEPIDARRCPQWKDIR